MKRKQWRANIAGYAAEHLVFLDESGVNIDMTPPYSPDLNPIEKLWSKLKSVLRKLKVRAVNKLPQAIAEAFHAVSQQDCRAWFRLCGVALIE